MPTLVTPTFYETRYFNLASGTFQKRIIQQRYVYLVSGFKSNGQPKSCSEHFTLDDGKLYRKNANVNTWSPSPISAGNYNVHVTDSNKPISDPQKTLNQYNCSNMQTVSSEKKQSVEIPWSKEVIRNKIITDLNINRRGAWAQQNPNYAEMNYDWNYTTIAIHHSGNSGETDPVEIERKHRERGFDDVGYHLLINQQGRIFEGRRLFCQGAHIRLGNTARVGVLVMGDFQHQW